jgi:hypothetical protein
MLAIVVAACGTTSTRTVDTPRFYGYEMSGSTTLDREEPPVPPEKAVAALATNRRVAFVPPDSCLDMRAADSSTAVDRRVLRMQCGVTMSELEREAERAGFEVVTWQSLKGGARPLDSAKEQRIDLLFEVNELDVVEEHDRASSIEFNYVTGEGPATGKLLPLQVTARENSLCEAYHAKSAPQIGGLTSVLDIKMVQVTNGSVLWSYRHVEDARADEASTVIRFPVRAEQKVRTRRPWWPWVVVAIGIGIAAGAGEPAIGGGIAAAGVVTALVLPKKTSPVGEPVPEPMTSVLCQRPHIADVGPVAERPAETRSSTFRRHSKIDAKDALEEQRRILIKRSVAVFMKQLTSARSVPRR